MIRPTPFHLSRRLALRNRAETHDSSLARSKYATGNHFVLPSPTQQNDKIFKNLDEDSSITTNHNNKEFSLAERYHKDKVGHQEIPMKDWMIAKPLRWQTEWVQYMKKKQALDCAAKEESSKKLESVKNDGINVGIHSRAKTDLINFDWEKEVTAFNFRMGLTEESAFSVDELRLNLGSTKIWNSSEGKNFITNYVQAITDICFGNLPTEGQNSVKETILENSYIKYQLEHTGLFDFFPNLDSDQEFNDHIRKSLNFLISSLLKKDPSKKAAVKFLQSILLPGLLQKDVLRDLWKLNPNQAKNYLESSREGKKIETRLIEQSSEDSEIIRVYQVGVYDAETKDFLASSFGETIWEAEWDACMVALGKILEVQRCQYNLYRVLI